MANFFSLVWAFQTAVALSAPVKANHRPSGLNTSRPPLPLGEAGGIVSSSLWV
jgi:hypothetical protein